MDSHVNLSDQIRSLEKHSPLISGIIFLRSHQQKVQSLNRKRGAVCSFSTLIKGFITKTVAL